MNMLYISKKAVKRLIRILCGKKGIYGSVGHRNRYCSHVFIHEMSNVGSYNYFGDNVMITNAKIGNYCSIAPGVKIGQAKHSISYITTYNRISSKNINYTMFNKPSDIGNDVWIGANAVIMQGVKIGNGAVIGANAVVTKDVPDFAVAVGVPAKVIKYRFEQKQIERINNSCWWDNSIKAACAIIKDLEDEIYENTAY